MVIPFTDNSAHLENDFCTLRRISETLSFISDTDLGDRKILDIGEENFVSETLKENFGIWVDNTLECDFNDKLKTPSKSYDMVWCFEVIEHIMNPLLFLRNIRSKMRAGGVLYLSTPLHNKYGFFFNDTCHFSEYTERNLEILLKYAGFKTTNRRKFKSIPFFKGMRGGIFRTFLRVTSQETMLFRCVKI